ncbi:MAG: deoxyribonuclease IV [Clostridia bacterium]|nr:deoxyribonuclease IV [Clostridia bacterium]
MLNIGCHLSVSEGFLNMAKTAQSIGANTFQFFLRNPHSAKDIKFSDEDIENFKDFAQKNNFTQIVAHSPYTMNLCSAKPGVRKFSAQILKSDLTEMNKIPGNFYNLHPGSHTGLGIKKGIEFISETLGKIFSQNNFETTVVLETMSGKGSEVGSTFDEISDIIKNSGAGKNLGVCFDTCHMFDAGFDFNNVEKILDEFDKKIGIEKLKAMHLNDSKNPMGSRKDRHEKIGQGFLGLEVFRKILNNSYIKNLPMILETPNDLPGYAEEILILKSLV